MNYTFHHSLILRTPLRPFKTTFTEQDLTELFSEKMIQEALFLASPSLLEEFTKWKNGAFPGTERADKLIFSLQKYALRMHARCTPFGLFATCMKTSWGEDQGIQLSTKDLYRRTRLDMHFSCNLTTEVAKLAFVRPHLQFFPNTSLYAIKDQIRYIEYLYHEGKRNYQISAIDQSPYIHLVLKVAKNGAKITDLIQSIAEYDPELTFDEIDDYINQIIESQLLVSEMEPSVSGTELLQQSIKTLQKINRDNPSEAVQGIISFLLKVAEKLKQIDQNLFNDLVVYEDLQELLSSLSIPFELGKLFQTDLFIRSNNELGSVNKTIQPELMKAMRVLNQLTVKQEKTNLSEFKKKFFERYEYAELPLLTVLDNEAGIGYAQNTNQTGDISPLIQHLPFSQKASNTLELRWNEQQSFLLKKLLQSAKENDSVIRIHPTELSNFNQNWSDLPDSLSMMFTHVGDQLFIKNIGGSSAIKLLGRFTAGNDEIKEIVDEIAQYEQLLHPNKIIAEIVHLPESRTGNILMRSSFRAHEIPYLAKSELPKEQQIDVSDLMISIQQDTIVLRSKRLNKVIVPRMGNAHNFAFNSLPIYHFLCDLQNNDKRGDLYFDWGPLKHNFSFLPRVEVGNTIISKATWQLTAADFEPIVTAEFRCVEDLHDWKLKWHLPTLVSLVEGDNELLINFDDLLSIKGFIFQIKSKPAIILQEYLFVAENAVVTDHHTGAPMTNEFIAVLTKSPVETGIPANTSSAVPQNSEAQRQFVPGSEWIYFKIYCGLKTADELLTEMIKPFGEQFIAAQQIDSWFFIRYADPDVHLRVRIHLTNLEHFGTVITTFQQALQPYLVNNLIWRLQLDTYQRELERYGASTINLSEKLFFIDSITTVAILDQLDCSDEGEEIRWQSGMIAIDDLLTNFQFQPEAKRDLMLHLKTAFGLEFNVNKQLNKQLDKKFRNHQAKIDALFLRDTIATADYDPIMALLNEKSMTIQPIADQILQLLSVPENTLSKENLVSSYIHMLLNRLIKNKQRMHELVIYDFLYRKYKSACARSLQTAKSLTQIKELEK